MRVTSNGKVRRSAVEWRAIWARFVQSRLGPKGFCQREAIALGTFNEVVPALHGEWPTTLGVCRGGLASRFTGTVGGRGGVAKRRPAPTARVNGCG